MLFVVLMKSSLEQKILIVRQISTRPDNVENESRETWDVKSP